MSDSWPERQRPEAASRERCGTKRNSTGVLCMSRSQILLQKQLQHRRLLMTRSEVIVTVPFPPSDWLLLLMIPARDMAA